jgi:magnesium chelatase subunit D
MSFDADPESFARGYAESERALTDRIQAAQKLVAEVELGDDVLLKIAEVCAAFEVDGMRADIVTARTAVAHAAWHGRAAVTTADVRAAARLALPHRRRRNPFDAPGLDEELLDRVLGDDDPEPEPPTPEGGPEDGPEGGPDGGAGGGPEADGPDAPAVEEVAQQPSRDQRPREPEVGPPDLGSEADAPSSEHPGGPAPEGPTTTVAGQTPYRPRLFTVHGTGEGEAGRRSRATTESGRRTGSRRGDGGGSIHLAETVRAAAPHQLARGRRSGSLRFRADDLRVATREGQESNLVLFCVDASGSMAARRRMEQVKTAILSLLLDAYRRRDKVGLVTFRGDRADLALPPTRSVDIAATRLEALPAGGRTPLAEGLLEAARVLRVERVRDPRRRALLVVVTDGRATSGPDAVARARTAAAHLADTGVTSLVVDSETGSFRLGLARDLADVLRAEHVPVDEVSATGLTSLVHDRVGSRPGTDTTEGAA